MNVTGTIRAKSRILVSEHLVRFDVRGLQGQCHEIFQSPFFP
jgi:hypothetical protein